MSEAPQSPSIHEASAAVDEPASMPDDEAYAAGDEPAETPDDTPDGATSPAAATTELGASHGLPPVCPYLLVPGASWRSTRPLREHRCTAVAPEISPSFDTQRSLCLVAEHETCPRFRAAAARRRTRWQGTPESLAAFDARVARRVPRVAPIALDRPNAMTGPLAWLGSGRRLARLALAGVMIAAAALLLAARFAGGTATAPPTSASSPMTSASPVGASPTP